MIELEINQPLTAQRMQLATLRLLLDHAGHRRGRVGSGRAGRGRLRFRARFGDGAAAVVVPQCGENAANVLKEAGLKIYKTVSKSVQENIDAFAEGKLSLLENIHAGFHNHGGK